ncbi:MAG: hypothetical protein AB8B53_09065 [Flavobacteriales bacterium]
MNKVSFLKKTSIYVFLLFGFVMLYIVDVDLLLHPNKEIESSSKVNFIYQQF